LASASPRRKQLLEQAGYTFEIIESAADETIEGTADFCVETLALRKAKAVAEKMKGDKTPATIVAADTLVSIHGKILEKPKDTEDAFKMLSTLSGNMHVVYTGVAIMPATGDAPITFVEQTDVYFRKLSNAEIHTYINTGEPFDKAGAYGIQGHGATLVRRIEGCFYTVMGLPIARLHVALSKLGINQAIN